jgi:hypothetical protein
MVAWPCWTKRIADERLRLSDALIDAAVSTMRTDLDSLISSIALRLSSDWTSSQMTIGTVLPEVFRLRSPSIMAKMLKKTTGTTNVSANSALLCHSRRKLIQ